MLWFLNVLMMSRVSLKGVQLKNVGNNSLNSEFSSANIAISNLHHSPFNIGFHTLCHCPLSKQASTRYKITRDAFVPQLFNKGL